MGLRVKRVKKSFGYDKSKTPKYVVVPDRATVVNFETLCEQVSTVSGMNLGTVQMSIYGMVKSLLTFLREGHSVQVKGFGTFIPSFQAKSSLVEDEANIDSIKRVKLRFLPSAELRKAMNEIDFVFNIAESTNDSKSAESGGSEDI